MNAPDEQHDASTKPPRQPKRPATREDALRLVLAIALLDCGAQVGLRTGIVLGLVTAGLLLPEVPAAAGAAALGGYPLPSMLTICAAAGWYYCRRWGRGAYWRRRAMRGLLVLLMAFACAGYIVTLGGFFVPPALQPGWALLLGAVSIASLVTGPAYAVLRMQWREGRLVWHENTRLRCPECGYDLRGSPGPCCPECGTSSDPAG